jgi:quercetin dioxygenase-like cupin family protein
MVLEGKLEFYIDSGVRQLHPGNMYIIPNAFPQMVYIGNTLAKVLDKFCPTREEYKYQS